jgi:hypothetical protein
LAAPWPLRAGLAVRGSAGRRRQSARSGYGLTSVAGGGHGRPDDGVALAEDGTVLLAMALVGGDEPPRAGAVRAIIPP